ncbi:FAD-binding oxidoreductase [Rhodobacteraceae bacterium RKSG542]|uniref:NAD(P)/FAD-dependent oxidoreductase n=1 Tax=Pseudovibrio flavus TaxID=2529854 RepID=UPI0012BBBECB|nr:FAD-dependent oxidoreductase [Pseudovibrio flavus]MTI19000.1 FAD-binding oxidoreductase [Pseudovibrio flavus]
MVSPHVTVIGAGITGSMIGYHLARAGARTLIVDQASLPANGVTRHSFGWIGSIAADYDTKAEHYALLLAAIDHYGALDRELGGGLLDGTRGAVRWEQDREKTEELLRFHRSLGANTLPIASDDLKSRLPALMDRPELALYAPDEVAIHPDRAVQTLLRAAQEKGAQVQLNASAYGFSEKNGQVNAVLFEQGAVKTDFVVVAAGAESGRLLSPYMETGDLVRSPAAMVRIRCSLPEFGCVVQSPQIEVRRLDENHLIVAGDAPDDRSNSGLENYGQDVLKALRLTFGELPDAEVTQVSIGERPTTTSGEPLLGRCGSMTNLFAAVGHPGVILAPHFARQLTDEIFARAAVEEIL